MSAQADLPSASEPSETALRQQLVEVSVKLVEQGLNRGTSGNCSARCGEHFLVTPSGVPAGDMLPDQIVKMDFSGQVIGGGKPSSEWRFHRDILHFRHDAHAVIHVHSLYATTLACMHREIPPFHYMIAVAGGDDIRCAPYALFGSQDLSDHVLQALQQRKACLMANHGMVCIERDLDRAFAVTSEVELLCEQYCHTLTLGGPHLLTREEMQAVHEQFKDYGKWKQS